MLSFCANRKEDTGKKGDGSGLDNFFSKVSLDWCLQRDGHQETKKEPEHQPQQQQQQTPNNNTSSSSIYNSFSWPEWTPQWIKGADSASPQQEQHASPNNNNNNTSRPASPSRVRFADAPAPAAGTSSSSGAPNNSALNSNNAAPPLLPFGSLPSNSSSGSVANHNPPPPGTGASATPPVATLPTLPTNLNNNNNNGNNDGEPIILKCKEGGEGKSSPVIVAVTTNTSWMTMRGLLEQKFGQKRTFRYDSGARQVRVEAEADFSAFVNFLKRSRQPGAPLTAIVEIVEMPNVAWVNH